MSDSLEGNWEKSDTLKGYCKFPVKRQNKIYFKKMK